MKLSESVIAIERAFHELMQAINDLDDTVRRRPSVRDRHFITWHCKHPQTPVLPPPVFSHLVERSAIKNKAKLVLLSRL